MDKQLIVITGPTAVGKTSFAIALANALNTEIISFDSRQFFQEMNIGTAKPSAEELAAAPHHFIGHKSIKEKYSAGHFEEEAMQLLSRLFQNKDQIIAVGGSGLYLKALEQGLDEFPDIPEIVRSDLILEFREHGIEHLQARLKKLDPAYYAIVDQLNPNRLMRGIEVSQVAGIPYSSFLQKKKAARPFKILKIGLELPREKLYERINLRVDKMMEAGQVEEAKGLQSQSKHNALQTVGYKELFEYFDEKTSLENAIEKIKTNSRRYAKRQLTWFKRDESMKWMSPKDLDQALNYIDESQA